MKEYEATAEDRLREWSRSKGGSIFSFKDGLEVLSILRDAREAATRADGWSVKMKDALSAADSAASEARAEARRLRGALEKYGWHLDECSARKFPDDGECDCGYSEVFHSERGG